MSDDINKVKYELSQKYKIPEYTIDEGLFPIYKAFSVLEENLKKEFDLAIKKNEEISNKIDGSIITISYKDSKTAFWGNFGKYASLSLGLFSIALIFWAYNFFSTTQKRYKIYKDFEKIGSVIQYDKSKNAFVIPKSEIKENGKYLIIKEKD